MDPDHLAALDEATFHLNEGLRYGYAAKGHRAIVTRPSARGTKLNLVLCVSMTARPGKQLGSVVAYAIFEGNMSSERFVHFLSRIDVGVGQPLFIILDNAGFHGSPLRRRTGCPRIANAAGRVRS